MTIMGPGRYNYHGFMIISQPYLCYSHDIIYEDQPHFSFCTAIGKASLENPMNVKEFSACVQHTSTYVYAYLNALI